MIIQVEHINLRPSQHIDVNFQIAKRSFAGLIGT